MKFITREIKMYCYTFAKVNVATGTVEESFTIRQPDKLTREQKKAIAEEHDWAVLVQTTRESEKYSMPVSEYITACKEYAERVARGEAEAPSIDEEDDPEEME